MAGIDLRFLHGGLLVGVLSWLSVYSAYTLIGRWPPFWSSVLVCFVLASLLWLLALSTIWLVLKIFASRTTIPLIFLLTTITAIFLGGSLAIGFYYTLMTFLITLSLASLANVEGNSLYIFRRETMRSIPELRGWMHGFVVGSFIFAASIFYDVWVLLLKSVRIEDTPWIILVFLFFGVLGAICQVLVMSVIRRIGRFKINA